MSKAPSSLKIGGEGVRILSSGDSVHLECGTSGCGANCCEASAPIVLNPYEIAGIRAESGLTYEDLLDILETGRAKAFPLVMLLRHPVCHFKTESGCGIYRARPLACRLFPMGRVFHNNRSELVLPEVNTCAGLRMDGPGTAGDYLREQDTARYIEMADRWIEFVSEIERLPLQDTPVTSVAFHMLVYSPDTPPSKMPVNAGLSAEESFMLRLANARDELPRFLKIVT